MFLNRNIYEKNSVFIYKNGRESRQIKICKALPAEKGYPSTNLVQPNNKFFGWIAK